MIEDIMSFSTTVARKAAHRLGYHPKLGDTPAEFDDMVAAAACAIWRCQQSRPDIDTTTYFFKAGYHAALEEYFKMHYIIKSSRMHPEVIPLLNIIMHGEAQHFEFDVSQHVDYLYRLFLGDRKTSGDRQKRAAMRDVRIVLMLCEGITDNESIASELRCSVGNIKNARKRIKYLLRRESHAAENL